jgi:hypothetical protein
MIPLFCRVARRRSRVTLSQPARTMSSTRYVYVRSLVSGTKALEREGIHNRMHTHFQRNGVGALSDIIIESYVTGKGGNF